MSISRTQISVSDVQIDVVKKDIKNMHLAVYPPTGRVRISSPQDVEEEAVRLFAVSKLSWIKKHVQNFQSQNRLPEREYISGESHYFEGTRYLLNVIEHDASPEVKVRNKKYIDLYVRDETDKNKKEETVQEWHRSALKKRIPPVIEKWSNEMEVSVEDWGVRQMKTKWGSCTIQDRRIWLNLELAKKSTDCLEYVVVHEMAHLLERHHNEKYKAILDKFMPTWRQRKEKLNEWVYC